MQVENGWMEEMEVGPRYGMVITYIINNGLITGTFSRPVGPPE